ncbi:MAG: hypothetical protein EON58_02925 [Alphaproteobacteria bacterium]|jgi:hypothetical protein|uniref:hypothetical protein n=1 Tax=unclassified Rhizobium TaxID=2613769 RepID=UPI00071495A5|nr:MULTISPECIES: hypothetical protein [unclassified Rhizobium]KQQ73967.1 hypothetical protein ASF70_09320 [Rhizobium sp. Leaf321]MBD8649668.1 hypothetical protein [Rhizobium sp. CFBP 13726]RYG99715.1 MAG: hypothetical protein EON58_02925 [Alphaproteobacteria bacterium]
MSRRLIVSTTLVALALSACTTVSEVSSPINNYWVGRSAGEFFAKFSPPLSDVDSGPTTIYNWRGGYKRIKLANGKSASVSCSAKITVSQSYTIRDISVTADRPGTTGSSYCEELLVTQAQ